MRKRSLLTGALSVSMALALSSAVMAQDDVVTIRLAGASSSEAENAAVEAQVAAFEAANPDIDVVVEFSPEYDTTLQTAFASGDYPNVFYVGQAKVAEYANAGVLDPAADHLTDPDDLYESLRNVFTVDGTFYCPPKDFSVLGLEFNRDLFDEAGVEYPTADWTWDDLAAAAQTITEETDAVGLVAPSDLDRWLAFYVQAGGQLYDEEGNFIFGQDEAAVEALEFYTGLHAAGYAATPAALGAGWSGEALGTGAAAMALEGNWIIQYMLDTYPDVNWGVTQLPAAPDGTEGTLTFSVCLAVGVDNEYPEQSWRLVDFLTGLEGEQMVAESGFGPAPSRASQADLWLESRGEEYSAFVEGAEFAVAPITPAGFQTFRDTLNNGIQQVIDGTMSAEDAISDAVDVAEELAEENS